MAGVCNQNGLDMGLKKGGMPALQGHILDLNNLALYHELMEEIESVLPA